MKFTWRVRGKDINVKINFKISGGESARNNKFVKVNKECWWPAWEIAAVALEKIFEWRPKSDKEGFHVDVVE